MEAVRSNRAEFDQRRRPSTRSSPRCMRCPACLSHSCRVQPARPPVFTDLALPCPALLPARSFSCSCFNPFPAEFVPILHPPPLLLLLLHPPRFHGHFLIIPHFPASFHSHPATHIVTLGQARIASASDIIITVTQFVFSAICASIDY